MECVSSTDPIRLLVVDDHRVFMEGLVRLLDDQLDIEVVGCASGYAQGVEMASAVRPSVAIVDCDLFGVPQGQIIEAIQHASPTTHVIVLTASIDRQAVTDSFDRGCNGFVTKDRSFDELVSAVRTVHGGAPFITPRMLAYLLPQLATRRAADATEELTDRELTVLELIATGSSNKDIAAALFLSVFTVRNHVQRLLKKLNAHSRLEAVNIAARSGLLARTRADRTRECVA